MHRNGEIWTELDLGFRRHVCLACETTPPFSLQSLALLREAQGQDHRLVATEDDKSPTFSCLPTLITAHWPQASQVSVAGAEDRVLLLWQRESETASGNTVSIHSFWRNARREPAIFPYRSLNVFICCSDREWIMGTRPQAPKTESCRIFCLPVKHQQAKRSKRSLGHQLELWAADGSICLSGRTQVFPDSQGHLLQTLNLNLDVTECLRKGWCWSVLCPAGTVGDPRLHSQALPSSPLGLGQGIIWSPPVWCPPLKPGSGPASQRHSSSI